MDERNITLQIPDGTFNYRVGAIIINSGKILMVQNSGSSYYYTVGGRVKINETSRDAVLRETFEETQIQFEIDRLAFMHENFFTENNGGMYHEICLFFLMKTNGRVLDMKIGSFKESYGDVFFYWLPIADLQDMCIYPEFFKTEIKDMSYDFKHFATRDGVTYSI